MKVLIEIDEETYKHIMEIQFYIPGNIRWKGLLWKILYSIRTGTPLPQTESEE